MLHKMFFDQSPDIMLIFRGGDGGILDANQAAVAAFGCKRQELLKKNFYSLLFSEDICAIASGMNPAVPSRVIETTHRREGAEMPVILSLRCVVANDEKIFCCTWIEITPEKQKFESLLEKAPLGMVLFDDNLGFKYVNPKFKELFSYDPGQDLKGRGWLRKAFPGPANRHAAIIDWFNDLKTLEAGESPSRIYTVAGKDGTRKTVRFVAVQLGSGEHLITCEDITLRSWVESELRKQALFLQRLIDNIPNPVFYKDVNGLYLGCNKAFEAYLGRNKNDIVGKSVYDISPKDLADEYHKMDEELFREPGVQVYESSLLYAGFRHRVIFNKAAYFDGDGNLAGLVGVISDIEERKKAEEEIRQSEALLRSIFESPKNIITFSLDKDYRYIFFNKAHHETMKNIWGADIKPGKSMLEYITYPEDRVKAAVNFDRAVSGENFSIIEEYGDGRLSRRCWENIYSPIVTDNGKIIGLTVYCSDITDRVLAEDKLRAANQQLLDIIDFLPDATFVIDRDGRVIAWNHVIEELTGVKKEDILGRGEYSYAVPFHGESRPILIDLIFADEDMVKQQYDYIRKEGNTFYGEAFSQSVYRGKGAYLWVKASPLFDKGGKIVGAIQSIRDITGLKHLEERFRLTGRKLRQAMEKLGERELIDRIIETSPAGILVVNNQYKITFANARAEQLMGLKLIGKNRHDYKTPKWFYADYQGNPLPDEELVYKQVISTGLQVFDAAMAIQWPNGSRTLLSINGAPLYDRSGAIEGAVLSIEDVTQRREAEEKIKSYQKQLRSLAAQLALVEERERRRIAEGIHDHIGQSLAVARLKIKVLTKATSKEAALIELEDINALIEEVINKTRSLTFELSPPILYDLGFGAAVEWLGEQMLEKNGIEFKLINKLKPGSLDEEIRIILFTVVRELFFNIVKHAGAKMVDISVQKRGDIIRLTVEDDGTGFDAAAIGPEYRRNEGFGLFSINERMEYLGGRLEIISEPGQGTRVTVEAPLTNNHKLKGGMVFGYQNHPGR